MKTIIYWQIVILLALWAWLAACGPRYVLEYRPSSDMYAGFLRDRQFCEGEASLKTAIARLTMPTFGGEYDFYLTACMAEKGWRKIKVFDKPIKKGD